jgi:hypothetical protein
VYFVQIQDAKGVFIMLDKVVAQRFKELDDKAAKILPNSELEYELKIFHEWATNVLSLLLRVFGENSPQYQNFHDHYRASTLWYSSFEICRGIFLAAKEDYESGYLFTVRGLIKSEDSTDILEQASQLLKGGFKDSACMFAGVALEITLKELCLRNKIVPGKLETMNVELCKKSIFNTGMQKQITAWAHWRNKAAHGEWSEYKETDVEDMIRGVTRFIAEYLI